MQNKGAIKFFAIALAIVCLFQLSFTFFSKRVEMTLYKKLGKGNAKYPSISLSLMPRAQRDQLLHILNSAVEKNLTM